MIETDIVITWVDGADPDLQAKRAHYLGAARAPLHGNGTNPHRWLCSNELNYCLRSIANNAPDIRRIWIVTDGQTPALTDLTPAFRRKISIVDHRDIFAGYEASLPTFNSLSIETFLWRIPGLAEHFIYFNDDVFLTSQVSFDDFFTATGPVMRGDWIDFSHLVDCARSKADPALLNFYNQIEAAQIMGFEANRIFSSAHVVHPMQRSIMEALFQRDPSQFARNSAYRFRSTDQFLPQSLHNHYCIKNALGRIHTPRDHIHVVANEALEPGGRVMNSLLNELRNNEGPSGIKFLCINDLPDMVRQYPDAHDWIEAAISA